MLILIATLATTEVSAGAVAKADQQFPTLRGGHNALKFKFELANPLIPFSVPQGFQKHEFQV